MPPDTTKAAIGGITEACKFNDHHMCGNPRCACSCHNPTVASTESSNSIESEPEKSCPKCGVKRPAHETFCRIDGERLSSLACNICGRGREPDDKFCFNCGSPAGVKGPNGTAAAIVQAARGASITVPQVEERPAIDYGAQVVRALQIELEEAQGNVSEDKTGPQIVTEQVGGTQGSFKLVSRSSDNKIRTRRPAGSPEGYAGEGPLQTVSPRQSGDQPRSGSSQLINKPRFRLPIKPL